MQPLTQLVSAITNGINNLGRKIDSLAMELRRKSPPPHSKISVDIGDNVAKGVGDAIKESIGNLKMPEMPMMPEHPPYPPFPEIPAPQVTVNVPEIKLPTINVPETVVNLPAPVVNVEPTPVTFPNEMKVIGMDKLIEGVNRETEPVKLLDGITDKNPVPVHIVDSKGKVMSANDFGGGLSGPSTVAIRVGTTAVGQDNPMPVTVDGFAIPMFDTQIIYESGAPALTTIVYERSGVTVATKTITVSGTTTTVAVTIA
jgi:hypothetical protein